MNKQLRDLDFSVRALNSFKQANINTKKELLECNPNLYKKLNFSNKTIMEIKSYKTLHENKNYLEQFWIFDAGSIDGRILTPEELLANQIRKDKFYKNI